MRGLDAFPTWKFVVMVTVLTLTGLPARAQEEESGEEIIARQQYFTTLRAGGPGRTVPFDAYAQSVAQVLQMTSDTRIFGSTTANINWNPVNPGGMHYLRIAASTYISGRTNSIAFHPTDPNTFYIAAAGGGLWKTTNGGTTFTALTDNLSSLSCGAVAVDPVNPAIVYLGTGELNFSLDSYYGSGLFKSTDAGASWTQIASTGTIGSYISQISIYPLNTSVLYVSGSAGVIRSTNAGASWTSTSSGTNANCVLVNPRNPQTLYITTGGYNSNAVKKSTNGGGSWTTLTSGLPASMSRTQLAMAASDTSVLYASVANPSGYGLLGLYRSADAGATWTLGASATNYLGSQGWYDNVVTVKPTDAKFLVVGGLDIYVSTDSGKTLSQKSAWATTTASNFSHADIHFLGYNGSVLYCGSDGGVFRSTNDGTTWTDLNATLSTLQYQSADYDLTNMNRLYGGMQDNNKGTSTDGGITWNQLTTGDGGYTVVDPVNTNVIYGQYVNGSIQRSTNSGGSYTEIRPSGSTGGLFYNPYEMAPGDHNTIVYGQADVWKTSSAQTASSSSGWSQIATSGVVGGNVSAIGISALSTNKIYIGTSNGRILSTANNGTSWTTSTGFPYVTDLAVDGSNDNVCYASCSGFSAGTHLYKTTDGGTTWGSISATFPNIPVLSVALRTVNPRTIFLGTDLGVYKSTDEGASWTLFNNGGFPAIAVFDLKYKPSTQVLLAATHGRGCWTFDYGAFLPIQLASFTAVPYASGGVRLEWTTISEINNYGFEVQRSPSSAGPFQSIAGSFVAGHGSTVATQNYRYDDATVPPGLWFYRLRQIDLDGTSHYVDPVQTRVVTGVAEEGAPVRFALYQNHPNPFNPSTSIEFDLADEREVTLKVYSALGEEVASLVHERCPAGRYQVTWDATRMASGFYLCRLQAGDFVQTRKVLYLK